MDKTFLKILIAEAIRNKDIKLKVFEKEVVKGVQNFAMSHKLYEIIVFILGTVSRTYFDLYMSLSVPV